MDDLKTLLESRLAPTEWRRLRMVWLQLFFVGWLLYTVPGILFFLFFISLRLLLVEIFVCFCITSNSFLKHSSFLSFHIFLLLFLILLRLFFLLLWRLHILNLTHY